jgi:hypothetical protein
MPKSNFNQLIDECEGFTGIETYNNTNNKIIFENKQPDPEPVSNSECETKKRNNQNINTNSNASSSNIFLSKNVNSRQNRFSMNHQFINGSVANTNAFSNSNRDNNNSNSNNNNSNSNNNNRDRNGNNVNVNMFKKASDVNDVAFPSSSSSSISSSIEINNETFPSLAPPRILTKKVGDSASAVPKKFKNFKDAITASAPEPVVPSPTKQKQIKALQELHSSKTKPHLPPPLLIKRESEMLAKTKKISGFYDNECDDDDDFDNDNNHEYGYSYKHKPAKKQYNDDDDSDD